MHIDPDELRNEIVITAKTDGKAYADGMNAEAAVADAYKTIRNYLCRDLFDTFEEIKARTIAELQEEWKP